jgi:siroheme synthase (precorrin-2 oxidase/ferrochelatase)
VAVSTSGVSPALSSWLRDRVAAVCGEHAGALAELLGDARARLQREGRRTDSIDWLALLDGPLLEAVRTGDWDNARAIVTAATNA